MESNLCRCARLGQDLLPSSYYESGFSRLLWITLPWKSGHFGHRCPGSRRGFWIHTNAFSKVFFHKEFLFSLFFFFPCNNTSLIVKRSLLAFPYGICVTLRLKSTNLNTFHEQLFKPTTNKAQAATTFGPPFVSKSHLYVYPASLSLTQFLSLRHSARNASRDILSPSQIQTLRTLPNVNL